MEFGYGRIFMKNTIPLRPEQKLKKRNRNSQPNTEKGDIPFGQTEMEEAIDVGF